ncbi:MAG: site-2 protease family protein [Clostridia bacterium]|nr:site-2 protease family protein [Clostridia bacterium]MDD4375936.1 site-2 protease family protein [Clostridia bacterium]
MFEIFTKEGLLGMLYFIPALLISLSIHEFSHSLVAYKLGDKSQKAQGRLTLSPFAHIDIMGFIFILIFRFGWGKPVVYDDRNFKNKSKGSMLVSLSGPLSNVLLAIILTVVVKVLYEFGIVADTVNSNVGRILYQILLITIQFNVIFAVFNMLPIPPFDGYKVLYYFLPLKAKMWVNRYERYGLIILILLLVTRLYVVLILPAYTLVNWLLSTILMI